MTHENEQASLHRVAIRLSGFTGPAIRRLVVDSYHPASWDDGKLQEATVDTEIQGYLTEFGILRGQIHVAIKGISDEAANWHPLSQGTNSVYGLLSHMIGADRLCVHQVINGETVQPDREADFASSGSLSEVLDRWERAWLDTELILAQLTHAQLLETRTVSFRAESRSFTIQWIILHLISHYATHLGHIQLRRCGTNNANSGSEWCRCCCIFRDDCLLPSHGDCSTV